MAINHSNAEVMDNFDDENIFAHYSLVFLPETVLSIDGLDMHEDDRRQKILPMAPIGALTEVAPPRQTGYFKNDDYVQWQVLRGDGEGLRFAQTAINEVHECNENRSTRAADMFWNTQVVDSNKLRGFKYSCMGAFDSILCKYLAPSH
ncbi:unnamed protein product [Cylindrotheca closterium]|uniref:Uncharacterized protein n=1 Tax=Cylindrotheca closterium TaxID=2856 RepID=A0AAD2JGD6_9STRA|nr:unnamed protein product [Cylindrotheca closterium]